MGSVPPLRPNPDCSLGQLEVKRNTIGVTYRHEEEWWKFAAEDENDRGPEWKRYELERLLLLATLKYTR